MLFSNVYIRVSIAFLVAQQVMLGISTLVIAKAGVAVAESNLDVALSAISWFFLLALAAFILNLFSTLLTEKGRNHLIRSYYDQLFSLSDSKRMIDTKDNRAYSISWVVGESTGTLDDIVDFYTDSVGTVLNLLITLIVFVLVLGWQVSLVISLSMGVSIAITVVTRDSIAKLGRDMQQSRLASNRHVSRFWDGIFRSSGLLRKEIVDEQFFRLERFFEVRFRYRVWEQLSAAMPIALSVVAIVAYVTFYSSWTLPVVGAAVAVLPRSLQLLGSAHAISIFAAQYFLYSEKYRELMAFWNKLEDFDPTLSIEWGAITLTDMSTGESLNPRELLNWSKETIPTFGRFRIMGPNGSGKSSIVRLIRREGLDNIYFSPESDFAPLEESKISTGQRQMLNLDFLLGRDVGVVILDEWDSNLDSVAISRYDKKIDWLSNKTLVIEIRHHSVL